MVHSRLSCLLQGWQLRLMVHGRLSCLLQGWQLRLMVHSRLSCLLQGWQLRLMVHSRLSCLQQGWQLRNPLQCLCRCCSQRSMSQQLHCTSNLPEMYSILVHLHRRRCSPSMRSGHSGSCSQHSRSHRNTAVEEMYNLRTTHKNQTKVTHFSSVS